MVCLLDSLLFKLDLNYSFPLPINSLAYFDFPLFLFNVRFIFEFWTLHKISCILNLF